MLNLKFFEYGGPLLYFSLVSYHGRIISFIFTSYLTHHQFGVREPFNYPAPTVLQTSILANRASYLASLLDVLKLHCWTF